MRPRAFSRPEACCYSIEWSQNRNRPDANLHVQDGGLPLLANVDCFLPASEPVRERNKGHNVVTYWTVCPTHQGLFWPDGIGPGVGEDEYDWEDSITPAYDTDLEVGVAAIFSLRVGINPGELLDFLLGFLVCSVSALYGRPRRIVHLEDPGIYEASAVVLSNELFSEPKLVARKRRSDRWAWISEPRDYIGGRWPVEIRKSSTGPRYLVVDADRTACALLDLYKSPDTLTGQWQADWELPPIQELRDEFGEDLTATTFD